MRLFNRTRIGPTIRASGKFRWTPDAAVAYSLYPIEPSSPTKMKSFNPNLANVKRILIVDDNAIVRRSLRTLLEARSDWTVCGEAENGSEGIDKAKKLHPDLIVIDLAMPVLNGIDATRLLRRLMPAVPILMFTTFAASHITNAALTAGVDAVIDKSEGATTLISSVQQLLASELPPPCAV